MSEQETDTQEVSTEETNEPKSMVEIFDSLQTEETTETPDTETKEGDEEAPAAEEKEDTMSSKFAALSRKEKGLRERETELENRLSELEEQSTNESDIVALAKADPFKALEKLGVKYEDLTTIILNDGKLPEKKVNPELEELRSEIAEMKAEKVKEVEDKQVAATETELSNTVTGFKDQIRETLNSDENLKLLQAYGDEAVETAYEVIQIHYNQEQRIMDISEALALVQSNAKEEANKQIKQFEKLGLIPAATKGKDLLSEVVNPATKQEGPNTISTERQTEVPPTEQKKFKTEQEELEYLMNLLQYD